MRWDEGVIDVGVGKGRTIFERKERNRILKDTPSSKYNPPGPYGLKNKYKSLADPKIRKTPSKSQRSRPIAPSHPITGFQNPNAQNSILNEIWMSKVSQNPSTIHDPSREDRRRKRKKRRISRGKEFKKTEKGERGNGQADKKKQLKWKENENFPQ